VADTTYYFKVSAANSCGPGEYSEVFTIPFGPTPFQTRPEPVRPSLMRENCAVKFQWTTITDEKKDISIEDYKLEVLS